MSTFSFWKQHNTTLHPPAAGGCALATLGRDGSLGPVPRALFSQRPLGAPGTGSSEPTSASTTSPHDSAFVQPPRPAATAIERVPRTALAASHHRPASAVTPGIRQYYNHLQPIGPRAREWMNEYHASAPSSRAASARPNLSRTAWSTPRPLTTASSSYSPSRAVDVGDRTKHVPAALNAAAPGLYLPSSSSSALASPQRSPGHWTETRKPRPPSPTPGQRRTSQSFFADVPPQPEEGGGGGGVMETAGVRRRSAEASFTASERVRVLLERMPDVVVGQPPRLEVGGGAADRRAVAGVPAGVALRASEASLTASAQAPATADPPARTAATPRALTVSIDEEFLNASLRAQTATFREGEDGRPVTAQPFQRRPSPVGTHTAGTTAAAAPLNAASLGARAVNLGSATAGNHWRPTVTATVGVTPPLPRTLDDYDWLRTVPPLAADVLDRTGETEDRDSGRPLPGLTDAPHSPVAPTSDEESSDDLPAAVVGRERTSLPSIPIVVPSSAHRPGRTRIPSIAVPLEVSTPHRHGAAGRASLGGSPDQDARMAAHGNTSQERSANTPQTIDDPSPPPRAPSTISDSADHTLTPPPSAPTVGDATPPPPAIRESFVDLLPGLQSRASRSRHSLDLQKERLAHAVPVMVASPNARRRVSSGEWPSAMLDSASSRVRRASASVEDVTTRAPAVTTVTFHDGSAPGSPVVGDVTSISELPITAGSVRDVSGVLYPNSATSTPSLSAPLPTRPMNPRLSQQHAVASAVAVVAVPAPPSASQVFSRMTPASDAVVMGSDTHSPTKRAHGVVTSRTGAPASARASSAGSTHGLPGHLATQIRQAIRDASRMRSDSFTDEDAPPQVTSATRTAAGQ